jgi:hypothetical protein
MIPKMRYLSWICLACLALAACQADLAPTSDSSATVIAGAVGTLESNSAAQTAAVAPAKTATRQPNPAIFNTPVPSATLSAIFIPLTGSENATPTAPATITPTAQPCNRAEFVSDVTYPDGTQIGSGTHFVKTWRLRNTGTCVWSPDYKLIFDHGNAMGGPSVVNFSGFASPGQTLDVSIDLISPDSAGFYEGYYKLMDPLGKVFGIGADGALKLTCQIVVGVTPGTFAVRHVDAWVDAAAASVTCPAGHTYNFSAKIITDGPGEVKFHWEFSDGSQTDVQAITFPLAGTQTVTTAWTLGASGPVSAGNPYSGWARVYIDVPNHQSFDQVPIVLGCLGSPLNP